jgi:hypothetical protein
MAGKAVEVTRRALESFGPWILNQLYYEPAAKPKGKLMSRLQAAAGPHKDKVKDPHAAGLALDIILFARDASEKDWADRIIDVFLDLRTSMNFVSVIYNGWEWNGAGVKFQHADEAHKTHIHIQWGKTGVALGGFQGALETALGQQFKYDNMLGY